MNAANEFGDAPLVDVAALGLDNVAEVLLAHGADPNAASVTNHNALHAGVRSGNARLVRLLLAAGANPRYRTDLDETVFDALDQTGDDSGAILATLAEYGVKPEEE